MTYSEVSLSLCHYLSGNTFSSSAVLQHFAMVIAIIIMLLISCGEGRTQILIIYFVCLCMCTYARVCVRVCGGEVNIAA